MGEQIAKEHLLTKDSYIHGASNVPLLGESIFENLRRTAARFGDREALVAGAQSYRATYAELVDECLHFRLRTSL